MSSLLHFPPLDAAYSAFHGFFLSQQPEGNTLANLNWNTDVKKSIDKFRNHDWTVAEMMHYGFLSSVIFFVFVIFPASFLIKIPILAAFVMCFLIPATLQFFVHALPVFSWLALFFSASKIPHSWKPAISVKFLPAMETILYGDNLSNVLAATNNSFLDVLAWLPYGLIHFASPFVVAFLIFLFAPPTSLRSFGFAFGYMNLTGVLTQLLFPAAAPWYLNLHGLEPANYAMSGSPGGLGRIDKLLGVDMYTSTFENSPLVFGAFPSLHSGCAVMDVLFLCWLFPKYRLVWWGYACLLWWSTMYLTHHYFIDLIFGAALSVTFFAYVKYTQLPVIDQKKFCRWSYSDIHHLDVQANDPLNSFTPLGDEEYELEYFGSSRNSNNDGLSVQASASSLMMTPELSPSRPELIFDEGNPGSYDGIETDHSTATSVFDGVDDIPHSSLPASEISLIEAATVPLGSSTLSSTIYSKDR
ncbi:hypothetical protein PUMCH_003119 [Australozyma saopauloensis]|uniref:Phosphatidic acid phosphatase type 2/haloperoxidase domain-containing protein n=1 Tax=Australozyma saopauloensis TaxID=291208 RepID=A0AAX4HB86_9ASCO|nr:hypothetical protein PUMCH_003119 [[Candida] saopauloensis]